MKKIGLILTMLLCISLVLPVETQAQMTMNPNGQQLYYSCPIVTARAYATTTTDTIPNLVINHWAQATVQKHKLGAASMASLEIVSLDSIYCVIYIDELIGATWTALAADSIVSAAAITQEVILRSQNSEKTAKLGGQYRARIVFPDYRTQGVTSATYTAKWLWKP